MAPRRKPQPSGAAGPSGSAAAAAAAAAEEAAEAYKQFRKKGDAKQLEKLKAAAEAGQSTAIHLWLAKAYIQQAEDLVLKRGKGPPADPAARMGELFGSERKKAEEALQEDVLSLLTLALEQLVAGVPLGSARKSAEKSLMCLAAGAYVAAIMRGRGSGQAIAARRPLVAQLRKFAKVAEGMNRLPKPAKGDPLLSWLPPARESPLPPLWPLEAQLNQRPRTDTADVADALAKICALLEQSDEADAGAYAAAEAGSPVLYRVAPMQRDWPEEGMMLAQVRLVIWPLLPQERRAALGHLYRVAVDGDAVSEAVSKRESKNIMTREQAQKLAAEQERKESLLRKTSKVEAEAKKKAAAEAEARQRAAAEASKRQEEQAAAAREVLTAQVAEAAGQGREAELSALLGTLRMPFADIRQGLQRQARDMERSEGQIAISRTALDKLPSDKHLLYCWLPETTAAVADERFGGRGAAAVTASSIGLGTIVDVDTVRVLPQLLEALECRPGDLKPLVKQQLEDMPIRMELLYKHALTDDDPDLSKVSLIAHADLVLATQNPLPAELSVPGEDRPPAEQDLQFLKVAAEQGRQRALASLYEPAWEEFKSMYPLSAETTVDAGSKQAAEGEPVDVEPAGQPTAPEPEPGTGGGTTVAGQPAAETADGLLAWGPPKAPAHVDPANCYGHTFDFSNLVMAYMTGHQLLTLHEAAQKKERPQGWEWWRYPMLAGHSVLASCAASNTILDLGQRLAAMQPDREVLLETAAATDAFNHWLVSTQRAAAFRLAAVNAADVAAAAQEQAAAVAAGKTQEQEPGAAAAAAATAAAEAAAAEAAAVEAATAQAAGSPEQLTVDMTGDHVEWIMQGLTAVSLAAATAGSDLPDVTADAGGAAAWLRQHKRSTAERTLLALQVLHGGKLLLQPVLTSIQEFVMDHVPEEVAAAALSGEGAGDAASSGGTGDAAAIAGGQGSPAQGSAAAAAAEGQAGGGVMSEPAAAMLTSDALIALLPHMPLAALHQLLAFVCMMLCWRTHALPGMSQVLAEGEQATFEACLELRRAKGGEQEAVLTESGLHWALLSQQQAQAPFQPSHFTSDDVPIADMAAQIAAFALAEAGAEAAEQTAPVPLTVPAGSSGEPKAAAAASSIGTEGAPAAEPAAASTGGGAGEGEGAAQQLPVHLRLHAAASAWQPPATLAEQLRLVLGASTGEAKSELDMLSQAAGEARLAAYYAFVLHEYETLAEAALEELKHQLSLGLLPGLQDWLLEFDPAVLRPPPRWEHQRDAAVQALRTAQQYNGLLMYCQAVGEFKTVCNTLAQWRDIQVPAVRSQLEAAATEQERQAAQAALDAAQQNVTFYETQVSTVKEIMLEHNRALWEATNKQYCTKPVADATKQLEDAMEQLGSLKPAPGSAAAIQHRKQLLAEAKDNALDAIANLENELCRLLDDAAHAKYLVNLQSEQLVLALRERQGLLLRACCISAPTRVAADLLRYLLPAAWQAELKRAQAAKDTGSLDELLQEEEQAQKELERQRQAEAERREAERRAKAKRAKKAAGGGGAGKGAAKANWREQLDDLAGAEADEQEEEEADQAEQALSSEAQANLDRLYEQTGGEEEEEVDRSGWQQAGAASRPPPPLQHSWQGEPSRHPGQQQQQRPGSGASPAVLTVPRPRTAVPGSAPAIAAPRRAIKSAGAAGSNAAGAAAGVSMAGGAAGDSWSFDSWGPQQGSRQEDDDLEGLLAKMDIRSAQQPAEAVEEEEDADLAAAIAASLASASAPPPYAEARAAAAAAGSPGRASSSLELALGLSGLRNETGEYNCFLNVIVQCLWHNSEFRAQVAQWSPEFAGADPVVAALHALFQALQQQQEQEAAAAAAGSSSASAPPSAVPAKPSWAAAAGGSGASAPASPANHSWAAAAGGSGDSAPASPANPSWAAAVGGVSQSAQAQQKGSGQERAPVDPTPLREALEEMEGRSFKQGEMQDAGEVMMSIYEKIMDVERQLFGPARDDAPRPGGVQHSFGLSVHEEVHCHTCAKVTQQSDYVQYFYNTQATMLRVLYDEGVSLGDLLRQAEAQHQKSCDEDFGGCGAPNAVNHFLQGAPCVFTLQLAWESHNEESDDIGTTLAAIDEQVDLGEVYQGTDRGRHVYRLRSMVCYYGQHYQALVLVPDAGGWLMFDDTRVTRVGSWADVRRKCEAGRIQPSVLFYEAAAA